MYSLELITTGDGSHSLFVPELNETYHSVHGAITESKHVFIKNGYRQLVSGKNPDKINILEIGLGTGLNVLLTLYENKKFMRDILYTAIEPYPIPETLLSKLNYHKIINISGAERIFENIHRCPWNESIKFDEFFCLHKVNIKYQNYIPGIEQFDLIYYDAFAPGKQPALWDKNLIQKTADSITSSGILVTYAAQGQLKRDLREAGLEVETLQGPPGKKEMTRAIKP